MLALSMSIYAWAKAMFGEIALSKEERIKRFFEEACELAQACDLGRDDARIILDRAFSRPKDIPFKEVGGTMVTLLALCASHMIDPEEALTIEFQRIISKPASHWREKHDAKVAAGTTSSYSG